MLVAGYWLLVTGCWLLVTGCWLLVAQMRKVFNALKNQQPVTSN